MRIAVDRNRCEGHAQCVATAPSVFALDDDDYAEVLLAEVPTGLREAAAKAVEACPVAALRVETREG